MYYNKKEVIQIIINSWRTNKIPIGKKETWIIDLIVTIIMFYVYIYV